MDTIGSFRCAPLRTPQLLQLLGLLNLVALSASALVTPHRPPPASWVRSLCGTPSSVQPPTPDGPLRVGRDHPGNDVFPCGVHGCVMAANSTIVDCKAKCSQAGLCGGVVLAAAECSGRGGPVCWTKSNLSTVSIPGTCRNSQSVGYEGSNGVDITTQWTSNVSASTVPLPEYPRPQMVRVARHVASETASYKTLRETGHSVTWQNLNGLWEWERAADMVNDTVPTPPFGRTLNSSILVPFPVESCLSGVAPQLIEPVSRAEAPKSVWYRLTFTTNKGFGNGDGAGPPGRLLLHFGAIDWRSAIFVDGQNVANHTGGYDGIDLDITDALGTREPVKHELLVYAYDPSSLGGQPNGKQNSYSIHSPGGGQYTPSSGIWQTVWLEAVPATFISALSLRQNSTSSVAISAAVEGAKISAGTRVSFSVVDGPKVVAKRIVAPGVVVTLAIPSPRVWGPGAPNLYDVRITLLTVRAAESNGETAVTTVVDEVVGYFGLRSVRLGKQSRRLSRNSNSSSGGGGVVRPLLNGRFTFFAGWLDQSWWPDGLYTAPTDDALASDVRAVPKFGLNMVRLHMKVNPERWYYHADRTGVVVFQDMVQKICTTHCTQENLAYYLADLRAMILGRKNHPSVVQFTLLNEEDMWRLFDEKPYDLPGLLHLARGLAPDHLINLESGANGGYENAPGRAQLGDVVDVHTYPAPTVRPNASKSQYAMIGEFGGVGAFVAGKEWRPPTPTQKSCFAYNLPAHPLSTPAKEAQAYIKMIDTLVSWSDTLSASVYTQISDVELECDGLLNYDRSNKFDDTNIAAIKEANLRLTQPGVEMQPEYDGI